MHIRQLHFETQRNFHEQNKRPSTITTIVSWCLYEKCSNQNKKSTNIEKHPTCGWWTESVGEVTIFLQQFSKLRETINFVQIK